MEQHKGALGILECVPLQYVIEKKGEDCHLYKPKVSPDWILSGGEKGRARNIQKKKKTWHETVSKGGVPWTDGVRHLSA